MIEGGSEGFEWCTCAGSDFLRAHLIQINLVIVKHKRILIRGKILVVRGCTQASGVLISGLVYFTIDTRDGIPSHTIGTGTASQAIPQECSHKRVEVGLELAIQQWPARRLDHKVTTFLWSFTSYSLFFEEPVGWRASASIVCQCCCIPPFALEIPWVRDQIYAWEEKHKVDSGGCRMQPLHWPETKKVKWHWPSI